MLDVRHTVLVEVQLCGTGGLMSAMRCVSRACSGGTVTFRGEGEHVCL